MLRIYKTDGIILKRRNISEADRVLTIFTPYRGKIAVLAKGIRRIRSRRGPHLEVFQHAQMTIAKGKTWDIVVEAQTKVVYGGLREDLQRVAYAYRIAEAIDRLCGEDQALPNIFAALQQVLQTVETAAPEALSVAVDEFTLRLLWELGYLPQEKRLSGVHLQGFLVSVTEHAMNSDRLLDKVG